MKYQFNWLLSSFLMVLILSCNPCKNTECLNDGVCLNGECICNSPYIGENCSERIPCKPDNCINGGCVDNTCDCIHGYEGWKCDTRTSTRYTGFFNVDENCINAGVDGYACDVVDSDDDPAQFTFDNLHDLKVGFGITEPIIAEIDTFGFVIPIQTLSSGFETFTISGFGGLGGEPGAYMGAQLIIIHSGISDTCLVSFYSL